MRKELRTVDEEHGIVQITTVDERWYAFQGIDKTTNLPTYKFLPSVTWICEHYPKGIAFYKWLADKGWNEAEALKTAAGDKGSKVHYAIGDLLDGKEVSMESVYINPTTEQSEPLTLEEYECLLSFAVWFKEIQPEPIEREFVIINKEEGYAGMVDFACKIKAGKYGRTEYTGGIYIIDFKTSQNIWPSHELQISAYRHGHTELPVPLPECKLGILQLGYYRNKNRYKFTEIEDKYNQFLAAKTIWLNETKGVEPKQKDLPLSIKLKEISNASVRKETTGNKSRTDTA